MATNRELLEVQHWPFTTDILTAYIYLPTPTPPRHPATMKLDATDLRYILPEEFRVLKAVEQGSKAHHVVPAHVIAHLSGLQHSGLNKLMGSLAKRNLIAREQHIKYDGYRLTYGGYDFLAVRALREKEHVESVGHRTGVGKESDIYIVSAPAPTHENRILKIHRLGRISFRAVKEKRDYTNAKSARQNYSWMYLSRLAAAKEYLFMQTLHQHGFPVPVPIAQSRHTVCMSLIDAYPLRQIAELPKDQIPILYSALMRLIVRLARAGLIHGDFNEFNLLIKEKRSDDEEEYDEYDAKTGQRRLPGVDTTIGPFGMKVGTEPAPELKEGEKWEEGKGFARVVAAEEPSDKDDEGEEDEDEENNDDEDEDDEAAEEEDPEALETRVHLSDGATLEPILIDFPQMISVCHPNAEYFFDRDVACVRRFFRRRFRFVSEEAPAFNEVVTREWENERAERQRRREKLAEAGVDIEGGAGALPDNDDDDENADLREYLDLDVVTKASGYLRQSKKRGEHEELDQYLARMRMHGSASAGDDEGESASSSDEEEEEEEDGEGEADEADEDADADAGTTQDTQDLSPPSHQPGADAPRASRRTKHVRPSKDKDSPAAAAAAAKAKARLQAAGEAHDPRAVAMQIALERQRTRAMEAKHHGKKQQSGKTGRKHPGGKAKTSSKAVLGDASVF